MTPRDASSEACEFANGFAAGKEKEGIWNQTFVEGLALKGHGILPILEGQLVGEYGPSMAPLPVEGEEFQYHYPSLVAPLSWVSNPALNYTLYNKDLTS